MKKEKRLINTQVFPSREGREVAGMTGRFSKLVVSEPLCTIKNQGDLPKGGVVGLSHQFSLSVGIIFIN